MPERPDGEDERRRTPRFNCDGDVQITRLPSNGVFFPGKICDLSLGGCRLETAFPIESGARAEIIVHVNDASFRAVGEVRAVEGGSGACIEFVRLSAGGQDMLGEVVEELERMQAIMNRLKAANAEIDPEVLRRELENGSHQAKMLREELRFRGTLLRGESAAQSAKEAAELKLASAGKDPMAERQALVINVDLFG
ncbi:MAG: PilZ domain-containing protein [Terriglobales bacterium]|jgi:hypothetical protein